MRMLQTLAKRASCTLGLTAVLGTAVGCGGGGDDNPYKPQPAWSGKAASLPSPPTLPSTPIKNGDCLHRLRRGASAEEHDARKDVTSPPAISITGYIVDSNIPRAPDCAVHKTGKADPEGCTPEVPSFWIADNKDDTKGLKVRVVGWARNFAVIYDAMQMYKKIKPGEQPTDKQIVTDDMLNVPEPFPLPGRGRAGKDHRRLQRRKDGRVGHGQRADGRRHGSAEDGHAPACARAGEVRQAHSLTPGLGRPVALDRPRSATAGPAAAVPPRRAGAPTRRPGRVASRENRRAR